MKKHINWVAAIIVLLFAHSCKVETLNPDDISDDYNRSFDFAAPLLNINATAKNLFEQLETNNLIGEYPDGSLYANYKSDIELAMPDVLSFSNKNVNLVVPVFKPPYLKAGGTSKITAKIKLNDIATVRYDSLIFKTANLNYNITLPSNTIGTLNITFPELLDTQNKPLVISEAITSNKTNYSGVRSLDMHKIVFSHGVDSSYIKVVTSIAFTNTPSNSNATTQLNFGLSQMDPNVVFGYFGQRQLTTSVPTIDMDYFDENQLGSIVEFADLRVNIITQNYIGAPFSVKIDNLKAENTKTNQTKTLTVAGSTSNTRMLNTPTWKNSTVPTIDSFKISKSNSNIMDIVSLLPNKVSCSLTTTINPSNTAALNFIKKDTKIVSTIELQLPLWFRTKSYIRKDTIDFDFEDMFGDNDEQIDRMEFIKLHLQNNNGFPFNIQSQAYFTTENYTVIDSLFTSGAGTISKACTVKSNYQLDKPTKTTLVSELNNAKIKKLNSSMVKYIILVSKASTPSLSNPQEYIKIFNNNFMDISLQIELSAKNSTN